MHGLSSRLKTETSSPPKCFQLTTELRPDFAKLDLESAGCTKAADFGETMCLAPALLHKNAPRPTLEEYPAKRPQGRSTFPLRRYQTHTRSQCPQTCQTPGRSLILCNRQNLRSRPQPHASMVSSTSPRCTREVQAQHITRPPSKYNKKHWMQSPTAGRKTKQAARPTSPQTANVRLRNGFAFRMCHLSESMAGEMHRSNPETKTTNPETQNLSHCESVSPAELCSETDTSQVKCPRNSGSPRRGRHRLSSSRNSISTPPIHANTPPRALNLIETALQEIGQLRAM